MTGPYRLAVSMAALAVAAAAAGCARSPVESPASPPEHRGGVAVDHRPDPLAEPGGTAGDSGRTGPPLITSPTTLLPPALELAGATAELDDCTLSITLPETTIGFAFDSAEVPPAGRESVLLAAEALRGARKVVVTGHASSEGDFHYNVQLSEARARSVAHIIGMAMPAASISVEGVGSTRPVADDSTEEGRARNRRVVISGDVQSCPATSASPSHP